jgi:hypothetical protein
LGDRRSGKGADWFAEMQGIMPELQEIEAAADAQLIQDFPSEPVPASDFKLTAH